jgi:hypothetical protein
LSAEHEASLKWIGNAHPAIPGDAGNAQCAPSSGPIDATNLTHSATVSGGVIPIPLGGSAVSKSPSSVACSCQSVSPIQRANRSGPRAQNGSRARYSARRSLAPRPIRYRMRNTKSRTTSEAARDSMYATHLQTVTRGLGTESNRRHADFQEVCGSPTNRPGLAKTAVDSRRTQRDRARVSLATREFPREISRQERDLRPANGDPPRHPAVGGRASSVRTGIRATHDRGKANA